MLHLRNSTLFGFYFKQIRTEILQSAHPHSHSDDSPHFSMDTYRKDKLLWTYCGFSTHQSLTYKQTESHTFAHNENTCQIRSLTSRLTSREFGGGWGWSIQLAASHTNTHSHAHSCSNPRIYMMLSLMLSRCLSSKIHTLGTREGHLSE